MHTVTGRLTPLFSWLVLKVINTQCHQSVNCVILYEQMHLCVKSVYRHKGWPIDTMDASTIWKCQISSVSRISPLAVWGPSRRSFHCTCHRPGAACGRAPKASEGAPEVSPACPGGCWGGKWLHSEAEKHQTGNNVLSKVKVNNLDSSKPYKPAFPWLVIVSSLLKIELRWSYASTNKSGCSLWIRLKFWALSTKS